MSQIELMRDLRRLVFESEMTLDEISRKSGVKEGTIRHWINSQEGSRTELVVAVFTALGYDLKPVKRSKRNG